MVAGVGAAAATGVGRADRGLLQDDQQGGTIVLAKIGGHSTGIFGEGAAEIPAYDPETERVFVVNANAGAVTVLDGSDPTDPTEVAMLETSEQFASAGATNSVAVSEGVLAVAVAAQPDQEPGRILFYDTDTLAFLTSVTVGALPDYVTFSPDGNYLLSADEGEPSDDYSVDPESRISIVDVSAGVDEATVRTAGFGAFDDQREQLVADGVRIFGRNEDRTSTVAEDLEPEAITVGRDSETAWVTLQENNALAIIDLETAEVTDLVALGYKDFSESGNGLDAVDDGAVDIRSESVFGMYLPDDIASYTVSGERYVVASTEGDAREYDGLTAATEIEVDEREESGEIVTVGELREADRLADPDTVPARLDELEVTAYPPFVDGQPEEYEDLYAFGGRSFAIWTGEGDLVFESGNDFETTVAEQYPEFFNSDDDENGLDEESAASGPEPEGVTVGTVADRTYAFIGIEEMGGVMVYDVSDPRDPGFVQYLNTRDFSVDPEDDIDEGDQPADAAGDLGPEGLTFVSAADSPIDDALLIVGFETSGTTGVFRIKDAPPAIVGDSVPRDLDGDGFYEDVDGDGEFTIGDVQVFFQNYQSDVIQNNAEFFNFSESEPSEVSIGDVQALFQQVVD